MHCSTSRCLSLLAGGLLAACGSDAGTNPEPPPAPAVVGFVRANGQLRSGATIRVRTRRSNFQLVTSADGRFSIPFDSVSTDPDSNLIHLLLSGGVGPRCYVPGPDIVQVQEAFTDSESFDIDCPDSATTNQIEGTVVSDVVGPLSGVVVSLAVNGVDYGSVVTQENGRFAFPIVTWAQPGTGSMTFLLTEGLPDNCVPPTGISFGMEHDGALTPDIPVGCVVP